MAFIAVNTRSLQAPLTGVQRYTAELIARWNGQAEHFAPSASVHGVLGHVWEQLVLPTKLKSRVLFSPANTGPMEVSNQVLTIHDMAVFDCPENFNLRFAAWYRFLLPKLARRVRHIITCSNFTKDRVVALTKVRPERVSVIPSGASARFCPEAVANLPQAMTVLQVPARRYVLAVGSLEPRKNLSRLLHAWRIAQRDITEEVCLVIAGGAANRRIFGQATLGALPPRTYLTGHVDDNLLPALYAGAVAMVYPSTYEGFGFPPLEAMASGIPVLAGDIPALRELLGDAGLFRSPLRIEAIAEGICQLLREPCLRESLRQEGLRRAAQFSWDSAATQTWELLQSARN